MVYDGRNIVFGAGVELDGMHRAAGIFAFDFTLVGFEVLGSVVADEDCFGAIVGEVMG